MISKSAEIIGIDMLIIITFPPRSTLLAIAVSPASLHMLTANSVSIAIPVIFSNILKYSEFIPVFLLKLVSNVIIPVTLSNTKNNMIAQAIIDTYIVNSGLYCLITTIIMRAISPTPIIFTMSIYNLPLYRLNITLTLLNNVLISFITIDKTITTPARVVIIAWSSRPALTKTW